MTPLHAALFVSLFVATLAGGPQAGPGATADRWAAFRPLLGEWTGQGSGQPGEGTGRMTHTLDLDGRILVRRNHVEYEATRQRAAFTHDDLLITYGADEGKPASKAIYWDNEGHTINYDVSASPDGRTLVYTSEPSATGPRFRFTYSIETSARMRLKFEIAPPGKPDAFAAYSEGVVTRVK